MLALPLEMSSCHWSGVNFSLGSFKSGTIVVRWGESGQMPQAAR